MRMTLDEEIILQKVCKEAGINPQILKNIFLSEADYYYTNQSKQKAVIQEILNDIRFWAEKGEV
ncbi:hypothetical protein [Tuberibacillus sp. Marseille-P3662]|uniref:hypothetical protein n=1 Tax=Tuberibacillus sp. Marseille-P3662 TaxID=1965358 RepID=UPI000A1CB2AA|nr:hypothetical protein [Tuberibacillus sp. Marseille-P3662]